jgi:methyl-accepting chemotaxis protein
MAASIATVMAQQTSAIEEVRTSVDDLSRIGETNAAAADEVTATMVELSHLADRTRTAIEAFRF